jgi:hypothetical protein
VCALRARPASAFEARRGGGPLGSAYFLQLVRRHSRGAGSILGSICVLQSESFVGAERLGVFALLYDRARDGRHFPLRG